MLRLQLIIGAIAFLAASGVPALLSARRAMTVQRVAVAMMVLGSVVGLTGAVWGIIDPQPIAWRLAVAPALGEISVALDPLSAFFMIPVFVVPALGAVYGLGYWPQRTHPGSGRKLGLAYGVLAAAMAVVLIARDGVLFLMAWEIMALSAFFAATADDRDPAVREAGWVYLIATHAGTLCLLAMFTLWPRTGGTFGWGSIDPATPLDATLATAIFLLALIGFSFKAGIMPLHVWLPGAHANAPSHVSAVMSGVMLKMGIYGIVRTTGWLPAPPAWQGGLLLGLGAVSAVLGIAFAIGQRDLKRLLAYSSIENIGVIVIGLGVALAGRSLGRADMTMLGLGGALLHVWNHSLFKGLLFLNAGAVIHATGTRDIERLGGLAQRMPLTTALFVLGAAAICALPPLNGFVSEWMIYLGCFRSFTHHASDLEWPLAALGIIILGMVGAMAVSCFCRALGVVFLGNARSDATERAHDPNTCMRIPMLLLAAGCLIIGLLPFLTAPALEHAVNAWCVLPAAPLRLAMPRWLALMALVLTGLVLAMGGALVWAIRRQTCVRTETWGCGYANASPRLQYTGSSFGQSVIALFAWALRPVVRRPAIHAPFPRPCAFAWHLPDLVLERLLLPLFAIAAHALFRLRILQKGRINLYIVYFMAAVLLLLLLGRWGAI